ncbi:Nse4 C-terminal-domain-containing protein [Amylocarpus encephaloides]|uniref:Non-structural maintenance of chromosomes element 4 n=1 Tax=Amylocarpus encephaloides TaxID=45428 RepID=A0A9P8CA92_9HELO|nr:Nse4 C-terminal-domain-containing protein [Amylocarpus encephaloides]
MADSYKMSETPSSYNDGYEATPEPTLPRQDVVSSSSTTLVSSDKENRSSLSEGEQSKSRKPLGQNHLRPDQQNKRKRTSELESHLEHDRSRRRMVEVDSDSERDDKDFGNYDPDQPIEERRDLRGGYRDLSKSVNHNRAEYLAPESTGLKDTINAANNLTERVKQTSDATIDARLLVTTADLSYKKIAALTSGNSAQGLDLEVFLSKCRTYMRAVPDDDASAPSHTQRRRHKQDEDEDQDDEMLNWAYLGRHACLPYVSRPAVPGFLHGPLSLENRAKRVVVRKNALKISSLKESRPEVISASEVRKDENANLSSLCTKIARRMEAVSRDCLVKAQQAGLDDMPKDEKQKVYDRLGIAENGGLAFFKFVVNPKSFGQTVENMFYVSFLIKEGKVGISFDRGLPYLDITSPRSGRGGDNAKHQAVLSIDYATWREMIEIFDIKESTIEHRQEEHYLEGRTGWF